MACCPDLPGMACCPDLPGMACGPDLPGMASCPDLPVGKRGPLEWCLLDAGCVLDFWIEGNDGTLALLPGWPMLGVLCRDLTLPDLFCGASAPRASSCIAPLILSGSASLR